MEHARPLLQTIVKHEAWHARFLNTLALMEWCGAQKLSRSLKTNAMSNFLLEHVAEEYRHAYFLRRLAHKISNGHVNTFGDEHVFCKRESSGYIRNLDRRICVHLSGFSDIDPTKRHFHAYLLTTLVIETRALPFYNIFQSILLNFGLSISVKSIMSEEEHHLQAITGFLAQEHLPEALIRDCITIENMMFNKWIKALEREVNFLLV